MQGLRISPLSPERSRKLTEMTLQASPNDECNDGALSSSERSEILEDLPSSSQDTDDNAREIDNDECETDKHEPFILKAPPTIRRRRRPSDESDPTLSLSFMKTTQPFNVIGEAIAFPSPQKGARLTGIKTTPSCRALSCMILAILVVCALLSHYVLLEPPQATEERTAMTISEQQKLLKSYLGDVKGSSNTFNVKLPAGGNPIDLIHLLHSRTVEDADSTGELSAAVSRLPIPTSMLVLCSIIVSLI